MTIRSLGHLDEARARWNDEMYAAHPTPYVRGLARHIEVARVRTVVELAEIGPSDSVLEVGCEAGYLLAALPKAKRVVGVDISLRALGDARERLDAIGRSVELYQVDAERALPFARGEFDVILCSEMLEHTDAPAAVVGHIRGLATPETRVVISVPDEAPKVRAKRLLHWMRLLRLIAGHVEPHQSEWHTHAFSPAMLDSLVRDAFAIEARRRVWAAHYVLKLRALA